MKVSFHNLIQELKEVLFEKDELEFRDLSETKTLLPNLAYEDSSSMFKLYFEIFRNKQALSGLRLSIDRLMEFMKCKFEFRGVSRLKAFSGNSSPSKFHGGVQKSTVSQSKILTSVRSFRLRRSRKTPSC